MNILARKFWSPYSSGVVMGLLQIPTFVLMATALGASSSYVTVGAHLSTLVDGGAAKLPIWPLIWTVQRTGGRSPSWSVSPSAPSCRCACPARGVRRYPGCGRGRPARRR